MANLTGNTWVRAAAAVAALGGKGVSFGEGWAPAAVQMHVQRSKEKKRKKLKTGEESITTAR